MLYMPWYINCVTMLTREMKMPTTRLDNTVFIGRRKYGYHTLTRRTAQMNSVQKFEKKYENKPWKESTCNSDY